jgi:hypothetical protein
MAAWPHSRDDPFACNASRVLAIVVRVTLGVATLGHPEEIGGEADRFAAVGSHGFEGPEIFRTRPPCGGNRVLVANVGAKPVSSITSPMYFRISAAAAIGAVVHGLNL